MNPGEQVKKPLGGCDKHPCLCTRHPFIEIFLDPTTKLDEQSCFSSTGSAKSLRGMTRPIQLLLLHKCLSQCPAERVFQYRVGSGRVLDKIPGSGSGSGRVGVSKNTIGYFRVSFFLSGISGYFGYFRVCRVFSGISGFTHIY